MKKSVLCVVLIVFLVVPFFLFLQISVVGAVNCDEWPTFQGDSGHTGYSSSPAGPIAAPSLDTWSNPIDSYVDFCQPTIINGILYAGGYYGNIYAVSAVTGENIWTYNTNAEDEIRGSPVVLDGVLYVGSAGGYFYALDASSGNRLWTYTGNQSFIASPTVYNGKIFACDTSGYVYCFNPSSEGTIWIEHPASAAIYSTPAVVDGVVYVGSFDHNVYALDAETGSAVWASPFPTGGVIYGSPTVANGVVYIGSGNNEFYAIDAQTGQQLWTCSVGGAIKNSPAIVGDVVYFASDDGKVYARDARTGDSIWTFTTDPLGSADTGICASPIIAGTTLYIGTNGSRFYAINATDGDLKWVSDLSYPVYGSAAVAYGMVYYISGGQIEAYGTPLVPPTVAVKPFVWTMDLSQSKTFTAKPVGGSGTYISYQWYVDGALQAGETSPTFVFTPPTTGSYQITATVTDNESVTSAQSLPATISVNSDPSISIEPLITNMEVGQSQVFTATASDGTNPLIYTWYIDDTPVPSSNSATYTFTPISAGSASIHCTVTDSASTPVIVNSNTVNIAIAAGPSVTVTPSSWTMNVGQSRVFTANPSGGSGSYSSYQWYVDGSIQYGQTASTFTYTPSSTGSPLITVKVTDSIGVTSPQSSSPSVTVNSALSAPTLTPSSSSVTQGQKSTLNASTVNTGTSPYSYQWLVKAPNATAYTTIDGATSKSYNFETSTQTTVGNWNFILQVTDNTGATVNSSATSIAVAVATASTTDNSTSTPTPTSDSTSTASPSASLPASTTPTGQPTTTLQENGSPILGNTDLSVVIAAVILFVVVSLLLVRYRRNRVPPISSSSGDNIHTGESAS